MESTGTTEQSPKRLKRDHSCEDAAPAGPVKKKPTTIRDLPPEIILMIWETAIDLPPAVVYAAANLKIDNVNSSVITQANPGHPDRRIVPSRPPSSDFNLWRWVHTMSKEFHYARRAVHKTYGSYKDCRANPLTSVRLAKDIAVFRFPGNSYKNYAWDRWLDRQHFHRRVDRGFTAVGIVWDRDQTNAFHCSNATHQWAARICPRQLANFLDLFSELKVVYILIMLDLRNAKARSIEGVRGHVKTLIQKAKDNGDDIFRDSDRIWVSVSESDGKQVLDDMAAGVYSVINQTRGWYDRLSAALPQDVAARRHQVNFRVLVASFWKKL